MTAFSFFECAKILAAKIEAAVFFASGSIRMGPERSSTSRNCSLTINRYSAFVSVTCGANLSCSELLNRIADC